MNSLPVDENALDHWISEPSAELIEAVRGIQGRVVVLGAAGKMGFHVCLMLKKALEAAGRHDVSVSAVSRFSQPSDRQKFEDNEIVTVVADLSDPAQVQSIEPAESVFFLAGVKFGTSNNPELLHLMNVTMPNLVASHFRDSSIVALSTGCVYSFVGPETGGCDEGSPTDPPGDYAQSCLGRERAFQDGATRWGTKSCLIRLNYSNELRYGVLVDIAQAVYEGRAVSLDMGYVNVIWQADAVDYTLRALQLAANPPAVLNVTGAETLAVRDLASGFAERFGKSAQFDGQVGEQAWLNDARKCHSIFGAPRTSVSTMMDWIADWVAAGGPTLGKPTHFEQRGGSY